MSLVVLTHLIFSRICIGSHLINVLNSNMPHWHTTFSTPLCLFIYVLCSIITLPYALCILPTPIFCWFHVSAQPLPLAVLALQPPQFGTHYPTASVVLLLQTLSVASLKPTASSRPTAPLVAQPSASDSATGWHCALWICTYLLTYYCAYVIPCVCQHQQCKQQRSDYTGYYIILPPLQRSGSSFCLPFPCVTSLQLAEICTVSSAF